MSGRLWLVVALVAAVQGCSSTRTNEAEATGGAAGSGGVSGDSGADAPEPCDDAGLASDPNHCGVCGHSCLGGACVDGKCQPVAIFANDPSKGTAGTLGPLLVDGDRLFVGDVGDQGKTGSTGAVWSMATDGKDVQRMDPPGTNEVVALAMDEASVYWTSVEGNVNKVGKGGGPVATLATETGGTLRGLTVAGNHVFYVAGPVVNQLYQIGNAKAAVTPGLAAPSAVALSGSHLYFTAAGTSGASFLDGALGRVPVDLSSAPPKLVGPVEPVADAQAFPSALALDATHVFWLTAEGHVHRAKLDGTEGTVLAQGKEDPDANPQGIALDASSVYWTSWGVCANAAGCGDKPLRGRVQRVAKTGGPKQILAEGKFLPSGIGVDASAVYWTNWWFTSVSRLAL